MYMEKKYIYVYIYTYISGWAKSSFGQPNTYMYIYMYIYIYEKMHVSFAYYNAKTDYGVQRLLAYSVFNKVPHHLFT